MVCAPNDDQHQHVGVSASHLCNIANGVRCPSLAVAEVLVEHLNLTRRDASLLLKLAIPDARRSFRPAWAPGPTSVLRRYCGLVVRTSRRRSMRVHVDAEKCQGHNRCYAIAPEIFDVDDYGNAHELHDGVVPAALEEKARMAVANCPEYAISISPVR